MVINHMENYLQIIFFNSYSFLLFYEIFSHAQNYVDLLHSTFMIHINEYWSS